MLFRVLIHVALAMAGTSCCWEMARPAMKPGPQSQPAMQAVSEMEATDRIASIPEVAQYLAVIPKRSHGQSGPLIFSDGLDPHDPNQWLIYVGEDHDDDADNWHWFRVNRNGGAVTVSGPDRKEWISLDQWRQRLSWKK